jgi:hypothetical protein
MKILLLLAGASAMAACVPVTNDRIMASDLSPALPSSLVVGFAPLPGEKRVFSAAEVQRIARANHVTVDELNEICFELPLKTVTKDQLASAMKRVLPAAAHLEIVGIGKAEAPSGEIEFSLSGLEPADASGVRMWRGSARYFGTRKMALWARVKVQGPLTQPLAVHRGEAVRVDVASGPARLHFEAVAESDAREGDFVALKNPLSGKTFRAKVGAGGKVSVVI